MTFPVEMMTALHNSIGTISSVFKGSEIQPCTGNLIPEHDLLDKEGFSKALQRERIGLEKISEGLEKFSVDYIALENMVRIGLMADWQPLLSPSSLTMALGAVETTAGLRVH